MDHKIYIWPQNKLVSPRSSAKICSVNSVKQITEHINRGPITNGSQVFICGIVIPIEHMKHKSDKRTNIFSFTTLYILYEAARIQKVANFNYLV